MKIKCGDKYILKRDGTVWEVLDIEYPMDSHDPKLGTVTLTEMGKEAGKERGIQTGESVLWNYFENIKS
jgi:hypothetical protein